MKDMNWMGLTVNDYEAAGVHPSRETVHVWFGTIAELPAVTDAPVPVKLTARSQYKLYLNGISVLFGPCRAPEGSAKPSQIGLPWLVCAASL